MSFRTYCETRWQRCGPTSGRTMLTMFGIALGHHLHYRDGCCGEGLGKGIQNNQENFWQRRHDRFCGPHQHAGWRYALRPPHPLARGRLRPGCERSPGLQMRHAGAGNNVQVHSLFNSGDLKVVGALPSISPNRSITVAQGRFYNEETMLKPATWLFSAATQKSSCLPNAKPLAGRSP